MKSLIARILFLCVIALAIPLQDEAQAQTRRPPVEQPLVREGTFAVELQQELGLGTSEDEAEAESVLAGAGILPRNGWIGDYPVSPDILSEIYKSVNDAAGAGRLTMGKELALQKVDKVAGELGLGIKPADTATSQLPADLKAPQYAGPDLDEYYYNEGPPVVTYYTPPQDFYYMYAWVPYPFWYFGFWYPGYFILNDFHRVVYIRNRPFYISNHFNDFRRHRVFRVDPVARYNGRTYAGIGVTRRSNFLSTGVPRSERTIFNGRSRALSSGGRVVGPAVSPRGVRSVPDTRGASPVQHGFGGGMERGGGGFERGGGHMERGGGGVRTR